MAQIGAIIISDNINVEQFVNLAKADPKISIGKEEVSEDGTRYLPINKN